MLKVAYFGHDASDAAIRRRVGALQNEGFSVLGFMNQRRDARKISWDNVKLANTKDGAFIDRILSVFKGAWKARQERTRLEDADLILARNLDMLATSMLARKLIGLKTPVIYECLDIHRLLCRPDFIGKILRWIEGSLLAQTDGLIVSSPAFLEHHFEPHYSGRYRSFLIENRMLEYALQHARPTSPAPTEQGEAGVLKIGWVGMLRCQRSLHVLCEIAERFRDRVEIRLHGIPAEREIPDFEEIIRGHPNVTYFGAYTAPEDLEDIYSELDLVWSLDFMEAGLNSVWLLPNRIYEGGYYGVPSITYAGTQTSAWVTRHQVGFTIEEPLAERFSTLLEEVLDQPERIDEKSQALLALDPVHLVEPNGFLRDIIMDLAQSASNENDVAALNPSDAA